MKKLMFFLVLFIFFSLPISIKAQKPSVPEYYIAHRVYDTQTKQWIDLETLLANVTKGEVVFIGEQHNDDDGHKLELAIVQGVARRRPNSVVAMEMFERDAQVSLDEYFSGRISETEFLSRSRPWPNYMSDYRPIVEFARSQKWRVIGTNAPQRLARAVANNGLSIVERFSQPDRPLIAEQIECPTDSYRERFSQTMLAMMAPRGGEENNPHANPHANPHGNATAAPDMNAINERIERFYFAQCVKDETMGESIAKLIKDKEVKPFIVHINGAFHSDYGEGTMSRARRRLPNSQINNISIVPVENIDKINPDEYSKQASYIVFTLKPADDTQEGN
ncbi:MAG: ChaN family lipoprotein [Acidobacteria bacterium]|nr:ChaN family lipoprotein [Acidobacteriota bacterium]